MAGYIKITEIREKNTDNQRRKKRRKERKFLIEKKNRKIQSILKAL